MYGFSFNSNKAVRGAVQDLVPQTVVIETDSGLSTMTLRITTIITIIIAAAPHAHRLHR